MINFTKKSDYFSSVKEFYGNSVQSRKNSIFEKFWKYSFSKSKRKASTKLLVFLILFNINTIQSNNYYLSSSIGRDIYTSSQAQNPATPWKTLAKLNSFMVNLQAGDSILFKKGDFFYGALLITKSGTADNPIVFSTYGIGSKPILSGLTNLTNWKDMGGNKWEADCPDCGTSVNMLLINGISQPLGRYPNATDPNKGYLTFESSGSLQITDNELKASPDWSGGELVIRSSRWTMDRRTIQSHIGNTINFSSVSSYPLTNNYGYFIQNHPSTLDIFGEWYYNPFTKKVLIYTDSNNPASLIIAVATQNVLIAINNTNYIHFDGIEWIGANIEAINCNSSNYISFTNCTINFSGTDAVTGNNLSNFIFENNSITYTNNDAIVLNSSSNTSLKNNTIKNTGCTAGAGKSGVGNYSGINLTGNNNRIEYNAIDSTGYIPVNFQGDSILIKNNYINNFAFTLDDGGGIYTWNACPSNPKGIYGIDHFDRKITGNIILNGIGASEGTNSNSYKAASGIYLDDNTMNVVVNDNTIANCALNGIFLHDASQNTLNQNTIFNNNLQLKLEGNGNCTANAILNNSVQNNILFSKQASQTVVGLDAIAMNNISLYRQLDNNYYCRPLDEEAIITTYGNELVYHYNLSQWKEVSGNDVNSQKTPVTIPAYNISSLIGGNNILNGTFDSNIAGASCWSPQNNCIITWDNNAEMNGGALKYSFTSVSGSTNRSLLLFKIGTVVAGKNYIVKFNLKGAKSNQEIGVNLRKKASPYTNLTSFQNIVITPDNQKHEILFSPQISENDSCLQFEIEEADGPLWLDTIEVYEADVALTNLDDYIRFEYNATQSNKIIQLTEDYYDAKNNLFSRVLALQPFTSVVLFKKKPLPVPKNITNTNTNEMIYNEIILYPNPFNNSFSIKSKKLISEVLVYNVLGEMMTKLSPNSNDVEVYTTQLPQGVYFVKSNTDGNWMTSKLIKE